MNGGSGICVGPLSPSSARWKHFPNAEFKESLGEASTQEANVLPGVLSTSPNQPSSQGLWVVAQNHNRRALRVG